MYCTTCGKKLPDHARYCGGCGAAAPQAVADISTDRLENEQSLVPTPAVAPVAPPKPPLIPELPADATRSQWYYVYQGQAYGPETNEGMYRLMSSGILRRQSYVWRVGLDDWVLGEESELSFPGAKLETRDAVLDVFSWLLVFMPLILGMAELRFDLKTGWAYWWVLFILNSALVLFDRQRMRQIGLEPGSFIWWLFLLPVYIWKRCTFLRISRLFFWLWWATFVVSLIFF